MILGSKFSSLYQQRQQPNEWYLLCLLQVNKNAKLTIYAHLLRPILDAYYSTAFFFKSRGDQPVEENLLVKEILADTASKINEGIIANGKSAQ